MILRRGISVIIPTYKRNNSLKNCLYSILNQNLLPNEIIVVDNSTFQLAKPLVNQFTTKTKVKIHYISEKRKGPTYARNKGIRLANYNILAFLDDDCEADKDWLLNIASFFNSSPQFIAVLGYSTNGFTKNILSTAEHITTQCSINKLLFYLDNNLCSLVIDSKNFAIKKSFLINKKIKFDHIYAKVAIYEDIDFGLQIVQNGGIIRYNKQIKVAHYFKKNLFSYVKRGFRIGSGAYILVKKWGANIPQKILKSKILFAYISSRHNKILSNKLSKFISNKSILFQLIVYLLVIIENISARIGHLYMSIKVFSKNKYS
jgi:GT2 family glycosyltransferase